MGVAPRYLAAGKKHYVCGPFFNPPNTVRMSVNLSSYFPKIYKKIKADNIILEPAGLYMNGWSGGSGNGTWNSDVNKSYDPNTGVLSFNALVSAGNAWGGGKNWYVHVII